ncbi:OadG family protein [Clostridium sp. Marseille-P299]|uniref:OadG family protein n=1 Tax=Clostridium sp. Marseille-P299 TaxID=1805477 RepID=UPI00082FC3E9|nr:OadG family protein [Clostridium sp. Marseille-P299]
MSMNQIILLTTKVATSSDNNIKNTLLNIAIGVGVVCIAFIFLCGVVSIIRYLTKANRALSGAENIPELISASHEDKIEIENVSEEINLADNLELVAVITAAIEAYEEANGNTISTNGLYVRSIRKVNKTRWQNA